MYVYIYSKPTMCNEAKSKSWNMNSYMYQKKIIVPWTCVNLDMQIYVEYMIKYLKYS